MFKKMCVNVVFRGGRSFLLPLICVALLSAVGAVNCPPMAGVGGGFMPQAEAQGVYPYTKQMLHADGSDQGTAFTDSSSGAKTVSFVGWVEQGETQRQPFVVFKKCWVSLHSTQPCLPCIHILTYR